MPSGPPTRPRHLRPEVEQPPLTQLPNQDAWVQKWVWFQLLNALISKLRLEEVPLQARGMPGLTCPQPTNPRLECLPGGQGSHAHTSSALALP